MMYLNCFWVILKLSNILKRMTIKVINQIGTKKIKKLKIMGQSIVVPCLSLIIKNIICSTSKCPNFFPVQMGKTNSVTINKYPIFCFFFFIIPPQRSEERRVGKETEET